MEKLIKKYFPVTFGFTLIEVLIIFAILAGIAVIILINFPASQRRARDTKRASDIKEYISALERYSITHDTKYPVSSGSAELVSLCPTLQLTGKACPDDPLAPSKHYYYQSDSEGLKYVVWAEPEEITEYSIQCSNGVGGYSTASPSWGLCPVLPSPTPAPPTATNPPLVPTATATPTSVLPTPTNVPTVTPVPTSTPVPGPIIVLNNATGKTCSNICSGYGKNCASVGTNPEAADNSSAAYYTGSSCIILTSGIYCGAKIGPAGAVCYG